MLYRVLPLLALVRAVEGAVYCKPGEAGCWPSDADIATLASELDPSAERILRWDGWPNPLPSPFFSNSPGDQPLYGLGANNSLKPLYVRKASDLEHTCFTDLGWGRTFAPDFCKASVRDNPMEGWTPAFVAWPLTTAHVQTVVSFAAKHKLCISVAGTGHDFNNRHSCPDGMFIRTSLMKEVDWDLQNSRGYGWAPGNVRLGPGIVFDEVHRSASQNGRVVASGWAATVGVVGWSIGGGHGPFAPSCGLGVDNVLSADVVLADGSLVTASATSHSDLYFALRGGGGSTWGVITSITLRAHLIPEGGISSSLIVWEGTGEQRLYDINAAWLEWSKTLDSNWGGLAFFAPSGKNVWGNVKWTVMLKYVYMGSNSSAAFKDTISAIQNQYNPVLVQSTTFPTYAALLLSEGPQAPVIPIAWLPVSDKSAGGLGSVLVSRENATKTNEYLKQVYANCKNGGDCTRMEYYSITGNVGSPQADHVSISPAFRKALFHLVFGSPTQKEAESVWALVGSDNAYFNESPYNMADPAKTYYGSNAQRLQRIKNKYDSGNVFGCHNCVAAQEK